MMSALPAMVAPACAPPRNICPMSFFWILACRAWMAMRCARLPPIIGGAATAHRYHLRQRPGGGLSSLAGGRLRAPSGQAGRLMDLRLMLALRRIGAAAAAGSGNTKGRAGSLHSSAGERGCVEPFFGVRPALSRSFSLPLSITPASGSGRQAVSVATADPHSGPIRPGPPFPVVGIGASAGGLEAITNCSAGYRRSLAWPSWSPSISIRTTKAICRKSSARRRAMPVREVSEGMAVHINEVY